MKKFVLTACTLIALLAAHPAKANYVYAYQEGEYSITLPEAPSVETIWASGKVPYLDPELLPSYGVIGEKATFQRIDLQTGDFFKYKAITLKAGREYLLTLDAETVKDLLAEELANKSLDNKKFSLSIGSGTLKWGTASGYSIEKNVPVFNIAHFLAGLNTITVIRMEYSVENPEFEKYFKTADDSINLIRQ